MDVSKKSLWDLMNNELDTLKCPSNFKSLNNFITDDKSSTAFIRTMVDDEDFQMPDKSSELYSVAQVRARHSAITFLMGLVFRKCFGIFSALPDVVSFGENEISNRDRSSYAFRLWLITSLLHDKGYYSERLKDGSLKYEKAFKNYFLLTDEHNHKELECLDRFSEKFKCVFAHTYSQILPTIGMHEITTQKKMVVMKRSTTVF